MYTLRNPYGKPIRFSKHEFLEFCIRRHGIDEKGITRWVSDMSSHSYPVVKVSFEAIERRLKRYPLLQFSGAKLRSKNIEEFFACNANRMSVYQAHEHMDKRLSHLVGNYITPNCRRSIGDIYNTYRFYFPEVTLKEIATLLVFRVNTFICRDIGKRVYHPFRCFDEFENKTCIDEYGKTLIDWNTWVETSEYL